jgi:hypothetical protein
MKFRITNNLEALLTPIRPLRRGFSLFIRGQGITGTAHMPTTRIILVTFGALLTAIK